MKKIVISNFLIFFLQLFFLEFFVRFFGENKKFNKIKPMLVTKATKININIDK